MFRSAVDGSHANDECSEVPERELFYSILNKEHIGWVIQT